MKSGINWKDKVCLAGVPNCDENLLRLSFSEGYTTWGGSANNGSENTIYAFNNDLTWIKGKHTYQSRRHVSAEPLQRLRPAMYRGLRNVHFEDDRLPGRSRTSPQAAAIHSHRSCSDGWITAASTPSGSSASSGPTSPAISRTTGR